MIIQAKLYLFAAIALYATYTSITSLSPFLFDKTNIKINQSTLNVLVARTEQARTIGLSKHTKLNPNQGMLFVYTKSLRRGFTMKDTLIPLSIAFIDHNHKISEIIKMQPFEKRAYFSHFKFMFALEVKQGWYEEQKIGVGESVNFTLP